MRTLLIANRAEIACRVMRTAHAMGLRTVAVYTDPDRAALHVRDADVAVRVPSYLDVSALVDAAVRTGADAVHPGYGFVSERAPAARAFQDAGLTWIGPPPDVIEALGDKVRAKDIMRNAGLPLLPGGPIDSAAHLGFPLLVKAAAGGGGRGMRIVLGPADLDAAVAAASREAEAAFGDGTLFLERWLADPRHIEVQILADAHGNVIHLGERECSIQRRHQKVVEESPSPGITPELRDRMTEAAVAGARAVGYVNAGTWEFLVETDAGATGGGGDFYFLEVNTRLQVEHPVTEAVSGLDLVRLQLDIASGLALPAQNEVTRTGHAIEVRVVAEDPANGWLPSTGTLHRFEAVGTSHRTTDGRARADLGFASGSVVPPDYDSLLGKLIAHGPTRDAAADILKRAVDGLQVHGIVTNRALLVDLLDDSDFRAGATTTGYLDRHPTLGVRPDGGDVELHAVAAVLWQQAARRRSAPVLGTFPSGWRNLRSQPPRAEYHHGDATITVDYVVDGDRFDASVGDRAVSGRILDDGLEVDGVRHRFISEQVGGSVWVGSPTAQHTFIDVPRFVDPGVATAAGRGPTAPVPGTVIAVEVTAGDVVVAGQTLVVLEAMKLEHRIHADADGVVAEVPVAVGDKVDAHQVLVVMR